MPKIILVSEIIQGLIIGVGAGLFLSLYAEIGKRLSRREQIAFIRKRLIDGFATCGSMDDPLPANEGETPPSTDQFRFIVLEGFLRELQAITDHRTGSMSGAQLSDLHRVLSDAKNMHAWLNERKKYPRELALYRSLYKGFASIEWLGLPKKPPWE